MGILSENDAREIRKILADMEGEVTLTIFTQKLECETCPESEMIVSELTELSDRLSMVRINPLQDKGRAEELGVERVPAILVSDGSHARVRFYGLPSGYEFSSLLTAIVDAGRSGDLVESATRGFLDRLGIDLDMKVFVTPTCPYCPRAVVLAHRLAASSERVRAEAIEANEYPLLSTKYRVQGVPRTVINDRYYVEGALPEIHLVQALEKALADEKAEPGEIDLVRYLEPPSEAEAEESGPE
ncbi:thioredoxin family protein [Candidatus Fermentibacterales bacterium]|nr:thioredoxin family protein [Candidatus Fermentibacterales bacterium]